MTNTTDFLTTLTPVLAQAEGAPGAPGGFSTLIWMGLLFVGMYFLMIAPQRKAQKKQQQMIDSLKKGDRIITKGGLYAKVAAVKKDRVSIILGENTRVDLAKASVGTVVSEGKGDKAEAEEAEEETKS